MLSVNGMGVGATDPNTGTAFTDITYSSTKADIASLNALLQPAGAIIVATVNNATDTIVNLELISIPNWEQRTSTSQKTGA